MKKLLIILGAIFLLAIILVGICIGVIAVKGSALDKQSKAYVDRNLPLIFSTWDEQAFLIQVSPEFTTKKDELDKYFVLFSRKFGNMQSYKGCEGQSYVDISPQHGKVITAVYTAKVIYGAGPADIKLSLIKHGDKWQIAGFDVISEVLLQH
ncbi:MAG TPA: hypothetical protein VGM58_06305 [Verrucomicrobiae bacterium]